MRIEPLDWSTFDAVEVLWRDAGLTRPWNDPRDDFERALTGPASAVLGAFDDEVLAGTVMVGHDGHRGWVYYLAVVEARRGTGIGAALMAAAEEWLRRSGAVKVQLMVRETNGAVLGFYERLGYEDAKTTVLGRWLKEDA